MDYANSFSTDHFGQLQLKILLLCEIQLPELLDHSGQLCGVGKVRGLLTLHGIDQHLVEECQLFIILLGIKLDALGHEVLGYYFLQVVGMLFLVHYPADQLIGVVSLVFFNVGDLVH